MRLKSCREPGGEMRPLLRRQVRCAVQVCLGSPRQGQDLFSHLEQVRLGPADERHKHVADPPTLAAEAAHPLRQVLLELLRLRLQRRALGGTLRGYGRDDLEDFFWALYSVAASLTRWLPCSLGKVSTTKCAGLTRPSAIAAAAWIASSSSINTSSIRLRNWASTSGKTKCSCEPSTWTSPIPQAYITATSVRNRLHICSSEQDNSCFNNSNANKTLVEMGGRPRVVKLGHRWAKRRSTAATNAAQGNVSAHWRRGCVSGTKSA